MTKIMSVLIGCWLVVPSAYGTSDGKNEVGGLLFVFNQPEFAPGDTAFFTAYILPEENHLPGKKQIVSIKLFGQAKEVIHHGRVLFQDGIGSSQIIIPQNIKSGNYQFISFLETGITDSPDFYIGFLKIASIKHFNKDEVHPVYPRLDSSRFKITTDRDKYNRRSKVSVSISTMMDLANSSIMNLSAAVYREQPFKDNADYKIGTLVQTVGFVQKTRNDGQPYKFTEFPSYFRGEAFIKSSGKAVPDSSKITFYLNESDFIYAVYTKNGTFSFPLFKTFNSQEVFYRITYDGALVKDGQIRLHDAPINTDLIQSGHFGDTLDGYGVYARQKQFINQSYYYFASKEKEHGVGNLSVSDVEMDSEILLEKYEPFPSMAEIFGNIIPSVRYKGLGDKDRVRVFLKETLKYGNNDPLYIVDGIMTDDTKYILSLNPKIVRKIGVLRSEVTLARYGDLGQDGIVVIETTAVIAREKLSGNSLSIIGVNNALDYKKITHKPDEKSARVPDLRTCLYWNPDMSLNKTASFDFYTSDDVGYYIIQIAGLVDGQPFLTTNRFYVSPMQD
jgi:hypothetical protein